MVDNNVEPQSIHPDEYRGDLNPNAMTGHNDGPAGRETEAGNPTAYEVKGRESVPPGRHGRRMRADSEREHRDARI